MSNEEEQVQEPMACPNLTMQEWYAQVQAKDTTACIPCAVPPLASWYYQELEGAGLRHQMERLELAAATGDVVDVLGAMDAIKAEVSEDLRERLKEFDCLLQTTDLENLAQATQDA